MENELKAQILKEIMEAMIGRDGDRIRPHDPIAAIGIEKDSAPQGEDHAQAAEAGGDDDMSPDDADILEQLLGGDDKDEDDKADFHK